MEPPLCPESVLSQRSDGTDFLVTAAANEFHDLINSKWGTEVCGCASLLLVARCCAGLGMGKILCSCVLCCAALPQICNPYVGPTQFCVDSGIIPGTCAQIPPVLHHGVQTLPLRDVRTCECG